jgi:hypothetical protein
MSLPDENTQKNSGLPTALGVIELSEDLRRCLLSVAWEAIERGVASGELWLPALERAPAVLQAPGASFVTLYTRASHLPSKAKGPALVTRNQAISLAATLDRYNNGNLCTP